MLLMLSSYWAASEYGCVCPLYSLRMRFSYFPRRSSTRWPSSTPCCRRKTCGQDCGRRDASFQRRAPPSRTNSTASLNRWVRVWVLHLFCILYHIKMLTIMVITWSQGSRNLREGDGESSQGAQRFACHLPRVPAVGRSLDPVSFFFYEKFL